MHVLGAQRAGPEIEELVARGRTALFSRAMAWRSPKDAIAFRADSSSAAEWLSPPR
jgi:hypothetical protein